MSYSFEMWHGDCLELMKNIPDNSIDMVLTDPPYGTTACKWDTVIPFEPMWKELKRITKDKGAICLFGRNPFTANLVMSNPNNFKYDWIWDKHIPRNFINAKIMPMNKNEIISVFGYDKINYYPIMEKRENPVRTKNYSKKKDSAYKLNQDGSDNNYRVYTHKNPSDIIIGKWEANRGKLHPTQKPVALLEYLIKTYTLPNEMVLDFTMGSGSTGVACKNLDRKFIGIERDDKYYKIAKDRILRHTPENI
jgi:site-specific DNA-methyltransferase (adenine-specific)